MFRVGLILAVLFVFNVAAAAKINSYEVRSVFIRELLQQESPVRGVEIEGIAQKGNQEIKVRAKIFEIGYLGRIDADKIPIICTTSTCELKKIRTMKLPQNHPFYSQWNGLVLADLWVDQNSDGKSEWSEVGVNIGYLTKENVIKINPDIKFYYIEETPDSMWEKATFSEKKYVKAIWDARF